MTSITKKKGLLKDMLFLRFFGALADASMSGFGGLSQASPEAADRISTIAIRYRKREIGRRRSGMALPSKATSHFPASLSMKSEGE